MYAPPPAPKTFTFQRKIAFSLIIGVFIFIIISLLGETIVRTTIGEKYKKKPIPPPYNTGQKDDYLGWKMAPDYSFSGTLRDKTGTEYEVNIHYNENGFKEFGDTSSTRPKIFFIGDSFTASNQVSNEKSFFRIIGDSLQAEVFAYGHPGFGSLQEYMILDRWVDVIKPDLVVWEVCSNDFIDNHAPLEMVCGYNVKQRRPYLNLDSAIYYQTPLSFWKRSHEFFYFFAWLDEHLNGFKEKVLHIETKIGEHFIHTQEREFQLFDESIRITENIFHLAKHRLPEGTHFIGFSADSFQPQMGAFHKIFQNNNLDFYTDPAKAINKAKFQFSQFDSLTVLANDGCHWNNKGHEVIANSLLPLIETCF